MASRDHLALEALLLTCLLGACTCGENQRYAVSTTLEDRRVRVKTSVEAIVTTDLVRSGMLTTRQYDITVSYPGRHTITIANVLKGKILSQEQMQRQLGKLALRVSPGRDQLALDPGPFGHGILFIHLLPRGWPFHLETFDRRLGYTRLSQVDWKRVPAPLEVARRSMAARVGEGEFCFEGTLGTTFEANLEARAVAEVVLAGWPACKDAQPLVQALASAKGTPRELRERMQQQAAAYLERPRPSPHGLCGIVTACQLLGEVGLRDRASRAAVALWPHPEVHSCVFIDRRATLPADVKAALTARAREVLAAKGSLPYQRDYAREVLARVK